MARHFFCANVYLFMHFRSSVLLQLNIGPRMSLIIPDISSSFCRSHFFYGVVSVYNSSGHDDFFILFGNVNVATPEYQIRQLPYEGVTICILAARHNTSKVWQPNRRP
jgi:hypothetical protein